MQESQETPELIAACRAMDSLDQCYAILDEEPERAHGAAVRALVRFIRDLGYASIANHYENVRWG